jgi:hypothetical protein
MKNWYDSLKPRVSYQRVAAVVMAQALGLMALKTERCSHEIYAKRGVPRKDTDFDKVLAVFAAHGWRPFEWQESPLSRAVYATRDDGYVYVELGETTMAIAGACLDEAVADATRDALKGLIDVEAELHTVYALLANDKGLSIKPIGKTDVSFRTSNYHPRVLADVERIKTELAKKAPNGRLVLIDGPPGTGKSHLVRELINAVDNSLMVIVPPDMVSEIGKPQFLSLLVDHKNERPVTLVFEDADAAVVRRMSDNISSISALLNLTDGVLGELLNLRIVATTNAEKLDIEPALMRPGRLLARIHVDRFSDQEAYGVLRGICGDEEAYGRVRDSYGRPFLPGMSYALADIYAVYHGTTATLPRPKRPAGFAP